MAQTFESIATQTLGSSSSTVTFSSIPSTYTDLYIVVKVKSVTSSQDVRIRFNGDTSAAYGTVGIYTTTTPTSGGNALINLTGGYFTNWAYDPVTEFGYHEMYIMNYQSNKYKSYVGEAASQNGFDILVGLWESTSAITSLTVYNNGTSWTSGSSVELYGIKAA